MIWLILAGVVVAALAVFLIVAAARPNSFRFQRSGRMRAPAAEVFALVNDFHAWQEWSPWAKMDPAAKNTFDGPAAGAGAMFAWEGNRKVGAGRMTILESVPAERLRIKLEFTKPMAATSEAHFTFEPQGDETVVTWAMTGDQSYVCKCMGLVMNMDRCVGKEFEKGLASMREIAEGRGAAASAAVGV